MTIELQNKLYKKYPKIFKQKDDDKRTTNMCWGIECGNGWYTLIDTLCSKLQWDIDNNKYPQIETVQVKEKYGGLRFYTNFSNENQEGSISFAESISYHICEQCGTIKDVTSEGRWVRTLCKNCRNKLNKNNE